MKRSPGAEAGFRSRVAHSPSSRLNSAVAAALVFGSLSLGLILAITVLSSELTMAMPL